MWTGLWEFELCPSPKLHAKEGLPVQYEGVTVAANWMGVLEAPAPGAEAVHESSHTGSHVLWKIVPRAPTTTDFKAPKVADLIVWVVEGISRFQVVPLGLVKMRALVPTATKREPP